MVVFIPSAFLISTSNTGLDANIMSARCCFVSLVVHPSLDILMLLSLIVYISISVIYFLVHNTFNTITDLTIVHTYLIYKLYIIDITSICMESKRVYVKPHLWERTEDKQYNGPYEVRATGLTPDSKPIYVRFLYRVPIIVELDPTFDYSNGASNRVIDRLVKLVHDYSRFKSPGPYSSEFIDDIQPLYGAYLRRRKAILFRYDSYKGIEAMKWFLAERKDKQGKLINPDGIDIWPGMKMKLKMRNEKVKPDISLLYELGLETTGWFEFTGEVVKSGRISRVDLEYVVEPHMVKPTKDEVCKSWKPKLKELVVDAEAFSERPTSMPKPNNPADAAFCIGCLLRNRDGKTEMHAFCSVKRPNTPRGVKIHFFDEESDALKAYSNFIRDTQPDVIISHNGMGWDDEYLHQRWSRVNLEEKWPNDSRLLNYSPELLKFDWESSAYQGMRFRWIDRPGVIHVDLLPWSKRSLPKLDSYKLDYLDKKYGGKGKLLGDEDRAKVDLADAGQEEEQPEEDYMEAHQIFENYKSGDPDKLKQIVIYCVGCEDEKGEMIRGDCGITLRLADKFQTWMSITQMAKVAFVQPFDVFTRGMQLRTYNQVAREAYKRKMYITKDAPPRIPVKGAHVFPPMRGIWHLVFVFDFKGLYPSIIRRYNLCWTTYVPEQGDPFYNPGYDDLESELYVSNDRCHVFEWEEEWHEDEYKEWEEGKKKSSKKAYTGPIRIIKHRHRFLKEPRGILPANLDKLAQDREDVKTEMKKYEKGTFEYGMADEKQNAIKVVMNSAYGGLAAKNGNLALHQGGAVVTYMARCSAQKMAKYFEDNYDANVIYGDSVTADTPILCRFNGKYVSYIEIQNFDNSNWKKSEHEDKEELVYDGLEVWTDQGFSNVKKIIRHRCKKQIKRVITNTGVVDVTIDHSLLLPNGDKISPIDVKEEVELLHADLPDMIIDSDNIKRWWNHVIKNGIRYASKIIAADTYRLGTSLGYKVYIEVEGDTYIIREGERDNRIKKIIDLPDYNGYVYDLETENHHFSAGIGRLVVHNTDSGFIHYHERFEDEINKNPHGWGKRMAKEGTDLFEKPMELEFEKVFDWLELINKKQYVGTIILPPDPKTGISPPTSWDLEKMISRGLMFVKRGAAPVMQEMQKQLVLMSLIERAKGTPLRVRQEMAMAALEEFSYRLMSHNVTEKELTITQKIGQSYKLEGNHLNQYKLHLIANGKIVNPGDRIPYVLIEKEKAKNQGQKMELPELRRESGAKIDYLYYLEKRGVIPYDTVLEHAVKLKGYMKWHVNLLKRRKKMMLQLKKKFNEQIERKGERDTRHLDVIKRYRVKHVKVVKASKKINKWYKCLLKKKKGFGM